MDIFLDSDIVISSLISSKGAAKLLINSNIDKYISNYSQKELFLVCERLNLDHELLLSTIKNNLIVISLSETSNSKIQNKYGKYVLDYNDSHIIAGAYQTKAKFLISYNLKHYKIEQIKRELGIYVFTPGMFLQYLRSLL